MASFIWCGAYLEYPSDPWEHFRRLFRWQAGGVIADYSYDLKWKFAYFWGWTWMSSVPIESRRMALDVYSAFWQTMLAVQVYRLSTSLRFERAYAYLSVLAFVVLFGTNIFSYRYYALSSSPLALFAYFECLILTLAGIQFHSWRPLRLIPLWVTVIAFNHLQEMIFLALSLSVLGLYLVTVSQELQVRRKLVAVYGALIVIGFLAGSFLHQSFPGAYSRLIPGQVSEFGSFKVWDPQFSFYSGTIGIHGWLAFLFAIFLIRARPILAMLTLAPIFCLVYPPSVLFLAKVFPDGYLTYRLLYAMPTSFMLVAGLQTAVARMALKAPRLLTRPVQVCVVCAVVFAFAAPSEFPWRGRLFFQFYSPPAERSLEKLDQTAAWLLANRDPEKLRRCWFTTDDATRTVIATQVGALEKNLGESSRRAKLLDGRLYTRTDSLKNMVNIDGEFCGVLVGIRERIPETPPSPIARSCKHWEEQEADQRWLISEEFEAAATGLPALGWSKTFVPPFYYLYEP